MHAAQKACPRTLQSHSHCGHKQKPRLISIELASAPSSCRRPPGPWRGCRWPAQSAESIYSHTAGLDPYPCILAGGVWGYLGLAFKGLYGLALGGHTQQLPQAAWSMILVHHGHVTLLMNPSHQGKGLWPHPAAAAGRLVLDGAVGRQHRQTAGTDPCS